MIKFNQLSESFKEGLTDSITFGIAFIFLYLSIGMLGAAQSLHLSETLSTTIFIFSTPLQFLLVKSHSEGWILIPIILAMNARFILMSATLAPYIKETSTIKIFSTLILIVPSVFTACISRFSNNKEMPFHYFLGVGIPIFLVSILCTYLGYATGKTLISPVFSEMIAIVLPFQFTALAAKHWPHYFEVSSYWAGFFLSPFLIYLFQRYNLLLTPFLIGAIVVFIENKIMKKII